MRTKLNDELILLHSKLEEMGDMIEVAIENGVKALSAEDMEKAKAVIANDVNINRQEKEIESLCFKMLLMQQPVAYDLRAVTAALKMVTDMERIGDQAEDIAEIIKFLGGRTGAECLEIKDMALSTIKMVNNSVEAYVKRDIALAEAVIAADDAVDAYFNSVKNSLISLIAANPADGEYAIDLLMIAKYFERIGDHAVNIAEWVVFAVTGIHKGEAEL